MLSILGGDTGRYQKGEVEEKLVTVFEDLACAIELTVLKPLTA